MRPRSINNFAVVYLTYGTIMLIHGHLMRDRVDMSAFDFLGDFAHPAVLGIRFGIILLLGSAIFFRASKIAKWLAVAQIVIWLYRFPQAFGGVAEGNIRAVVWMLGIAVGLAAAALLFTRESRYFFASKGRSVKGDVAAFE